MKRLIALSLCAMLTVGSSIAVFAEPSQTDEPQRQTQGTDVNATSSSQLTPKITANVIVKRAGEFVASTEIERNYGETVGDIKGLEPYENEIASIDALGKIFSKDEFKALDAGNIINQDITVHLKEHLDVIGSNSNANQLELRFNKNIKMMNLNPEDVQVMQDTKTIPIIQIVKITDDILGLTLDENIQQDKDYVIKSTPNFEKGSYIVLESGAVAGFNYTITKDGLGINDAVPEKPDTKDPEKQKPEIQDPKKNEIPEFNITALAVDPKYGSATADLIKLAKNEFLITVKMRDDQYVREYNIDKPENAIIEKQDINSYQLRVKLLGDVNIDLILDDRQNASGDLNFNPIEETPRHPEDYPRDKYPNLPKDEKQVPNPSEPSTPDKQDNPKVDEPKMQDPKKDEPKKQEPKQEQPKDNNNSSSDSSSGGGSSSGSSGSRSSSSKSSSSSKVKEQETNRVLLAIAGEDKAETKEKTETPKRETKEQMLNAKVLEFKLINKKDKSTKIFTIDFEKSMINNKKVVFNNARITPSARQALLLRNVFEALDYKVDYDKKRRNIVFADEKGAFTFLNIDSSMLSKGPKGNVKSAVLPSKLFIKNDRAMVMGMDLAFILEFLSDSNVEYTIK